MEMVNEEYAIFANYVSLRRIYKNNNNKKNNNKRLQQKKCLFRYMDLLITLTLPSAMFKRELDLEMTSLEEAMLMELIPGSTKHIAWDICMIKTEKYIMNTYHGYCRRCGKRKINPFFDCKVCNWIHYCSGKCKREDMTDKAFGHEYLECYLIKMHTLL